MVEGSTAVQGHVQGFLVEGGRELSDGMRLCDSIQVWHHGGHEEGAIFTGDLKFLLCGIHDDERPNNHRSTGHDRVVHFDLGVGEGGGCGHNGSRENGSIVFQDGDENVHVCVGEEICPDGRLKRVLQYQRQFCFFLVLTKA